MFVRFITIRARGKGYALIVQLFSLLVSRLVTRDLAFSNLVTRATIRARWGWKSRETDAGLISLIDVNGINEAYAADRSGHH